MKHLYLAVLIFSVAKVFCACTAQQRLSRLIKKHAELTDTFYQSDTIRIKGDNSDTAFSFRMVKDTVVLKQGRLQMKYFYTHDSVFLRGNCRDSVVIRNVPFRINVPVKAKINWEHLLIALVGGFLFSFVIIRKR